MINKLKLTQVFSGIVIILSSGFSAFSQQYKIVDTNVHEFYDNSSVISQPESNQPFYGQDATYNGNQPSYTNNGDGTITDNVTGLMWQQDMGKKISYSSAFVKADSMTLGGYTDWRVPTIKELYSLIQFTGKVMGETAINKFIDTTYFNQPIGDTTIGEREIDAQTWSSTQYVGLTMGGDTTVFGVNFIDGRIKGYPKYKPQQGTTPHVMYFRMVRGNTLYGENEFVDNGDGTITDNATGLMWQQADDGNTRDWENALSYAEELTLAGYSDWRLPNIKELQSIVDFTRSPSTTQSPAINSMFYCTSFDDPDGVAGQYGYYWSGTTHLDGANPYDGAAYIAFGKAQGKMETPPGSGNYVLMDVHGAGAQRSDPKSGLASDYPQFLGPQGDVRYVYNYVRCVRDVEEINTINELENTNISIFPNPTTGVIRINIANQQLINVKIYNSIGKLVKVYSSTEFNISNLPQGNYIFKVQTKENIFTKKIIKL